MVRRQIERYGKWLVVIGALAVAGLVSASYILVQQRFPLPWQERYTVAAEFSTSAGLSPPGLGQPVNVAGVRVGVITSTQLRDGRSITELEIDPGKLPKVYSNASAVLVPNTPAKDMQVELMPGRPGAAPMRPGQVIPSTRTEVPIDSDELTNALDADTRSYFQLLVTSGDTATKGRGRDLRQLFKTLGPTAEDAREIAGALASRRAAITRLVHNLRVLSQAGADRDRELAQVVTAANLTLETLAREEAPLRESIGRLPGTLADVRRTLRTTTTFSNELGPTLTALMPTVDRLPAVLPEARALLDDAEPILRDDVRPLVREVRPVTNDLGPAVQRLSELTPELVTTSQILNRTVNLLAYNPPGDDEGGLFWLSWFAHNLNSVVSTEDANGAVVYGLGIIDCEVLTLFSPILTPIFGVLPSC